MDVYDATAGSCVYVSLAAETGGLMDIGRDNGAKKRLFQQEPKPQK